MSVLFERKVDYVGGAGIVAKHLAAAGGYASPFQPCSGRTATEISSSTISKLPIYQVHAVIDRSRPTVNKNAIVVGGYRLLKVDTLDNRSISDQILEDMTRSLRSVPTDAVVFSDFRHGLFNRRTIPRLVQALPDGCFRVADSQVASRWGNITDFQGFDLITPNEREAVLLSATKIPGFVLSRRISMMRRSASCSSSSSASAACLHAATPIMNRWIVFFVIDSFVDRLIDAVGAGDALLAYATLAMLAVRDPGIATILGTMAAAVECECDGNIPVTADDLRSRIDVIERQMVLA